MSTDGMSLFSNVMHICTPMYTVDRCDSCKEKSHTICGSYVVLSTWKSCRLNVAATWLISLAQFLGISVIVSWLDVSVSLPSSVFLLQFCLIISCLDLSLSPTPYLVTVLQYIKHKGILQNDLWIPTSYVMYDKG